jgi:hypothetical protein
MILFLQSKSVNSSNFLDLKKTLKISIQIKYFSRSRKFFPLAELRCKQDVFFKKIFDYRDSLPGDFLNDQNGPPLFSYSWLQRLGRMDIFSEKMEINTKNQKNFSDSDLGKTDPIFRLPKKKKKKLQRKNLDLTIGIRKEEKIVVFQNKKSDKDGFLIKEKKEKIKKTFNLEFKNPKITILEVSSHKLTLLSRYSISIFLIGLGFLLGHL